MPNLQQVIFPFPLESLPEDQVREVARELFEEVLGKLLCEKVEIGSPAVDPVSPNSDIRPEGED